MYPILIYFVTFSSSSVLHTARCLLCGSRVEITSTRHQMMLDELPAEYRCINQTKALANSYMWWPETYAAVEIMVEKCAVYHSAKNYPVVAPLYPWSWHTRIWPRTTLALGIRTM